MILRLLAILFSATAAALAADPLLVQPPLQLTLSVNGKEVPLALGEEQRLQGEFKDPVLKVTAAENRAFTRHGIHFLYPSSWNWEAEKTDEGYMWTMEGPDTTMIVSALTVDVNLKTIAEGFVGDEKREVTAWTANHGGRDFKGWQVTATVGGHPVRVYLFELPQKDGFACMQLIDSGEKDGKPSKECRDIFDMLGKSLRTPGA